MKDSDNIHFQEQLVQYLYDELDVYQTISFEEQLDKDESLRLLLRQLKEAHSGLQRLTPMPLRSSVASILAHSASTHEQEA